MRLFIASSLSEQIQKKIDDVVNILKYDRNFPVRWVTGRNIHLTLKFLGEVEAIRKDAICQVIQAACQPLKPFELNIGKIGSFPNAIRPRVIWIGISESQALNELALSIDKGTQKLGFQREERAFNPHLTIGRVAQNATQQEVHALAEVLSSARIGHLGSLFVEQVSLFQSVLTASGPIYTPLYTGHLKGL